MPNLIFYILLGLLSFNLLLILIAGISKTLLSKRNPYQPQPRAISINRKFSVHLPFCNEPSELVVQTIESILNQTFEDFELIVLSNNSESDSNWKPVKKFCKRTNDNRIHFFHYDKVSHFKAGAMNICLEKTAEDADYIFVIDADYILKPNALEIAVKRMEQSKAHLIQFPQHYYNQSTLTQGLQIDYEHYFECLALGSTKRSLSLPTGTLSVIKKNILKQIGGWPTHSITEDAALGVQLIKADFRSLFINEIIGSGLMPIRYKDLFKQRRRWVIGNFQNCLDVFTSSQLQLGDKMIMLSQLTAWINYLGIPYLSILLLGGFHSYLKPFQLELILGFIGLSIAIHFLFKFYLIFRTTPLVTDRVNALLVAMALSPIGAFSWWTCLVKRNFIFERTNKFVGKNHFVNSGYIFPLFLFFITSGLFINYYSFSTALLFFFSMTFLMSKIKLNLELSAANKAHQIQLGV